MFKMYLQKSIISARLCFVRVSSRLGLILLESRLGLVWLESRLDSGSFFLPKMKVSAWHQKLRFIYITSI